jgi:hypothetical protein
MRSLLTPGLLIAAFAALGFPKTVLAQNTCLPQHVCAFSTDHFNPDGSRAVHVILRTDDDLTTHFNVQAPGASQFEVARGGSFDFLVPPSGATTFNVEACNGGGVAGSNCDGWANFVHMLTCPSGLVWRESFDGDATCVPPDQRFRLANGNCRSGFVWRDSFSGDNVCVTPAERNAAKAAAAKAVPPPRKVVALGRAHLATAISDVDVYNGPDGNVFAIIGMLPMNAVGIVAKHQTGFYELKFNSGQVQSANGQPVTIGWVAEDHLKVK